MLEKENILEILRGTKKAIKEEDNIRLKDLSNRTIHSSSISQDPENIAIAVIVYSLSKIMERKETIGISGLDSFNSAVIRIIDASIESLEKGDKDALKINLGRLRKKIGRLSGNLKQYIEEVFRKASINKASKIYAHGISLEKTANLLGLSLWEVANYSGQTGISENIENKTYDVKSRIKLAMEMFS